MLEKGKLSYDMVKSLPNLGPTTQADLYCSQRRRAQLPLKRTTGEVIQGPRLTHDENYDGEYDPNELPPGFNRNGPLRSNFDQVLERPRKRPYVKKGSRTLLTIHGKRVGAMRALDTYPQLRGYLQEKGRRGV